jgi:outer membrane protein OmpA-like peptidoglycan-associated protein
MQKLKKATTSPRLGESEKLARYFLEKVKAFHIPVDSEGEEGEVATIVARCFATLGLALLVGGCATVPPPTPEQTLGREEGNTAHYRSSVEDYGPGDLLGQVFFTFDGAGVGAEDLPLLHSIAVNLCEFPDRTVTLVGYCDWFGGADYNRQLGQRRADAVAKILQREGVAVERIRIQSRGSQDSPVGLPRQESRCDRRVDILRR